MTVRCVSGPSHLTFEPFEAETATLRICHLAQRLPEHCGYCLECFWWHIMAPAIFSSPPLAMLLIKRKNMVQKWSVQTYCTLIGGGWTVWWKGLQRFSNKYINGELCGHIKIDFPKQYIIAAEIINQKPAKISSKLKVYCLSHPNIALCLELLSGNI